MLILLTNTICLSLIIIIIIISIILFINYLYIMLADIDNTIIFATSYSRHNILNFITNF
jgi:hypothetical protein|nr:MAG TPA: hypothetical protein [Crassvirales sp.]